MAHLWISSARDARERSWEPARLAEPGCVLAPVGDGLRVGPVGGIGFSDAHGVVLLPAPGSGKGPAWALLAARRSPARVNGWPLALGIRVLRDRDEIRVGAECCFFSSEELARCEPFPGLAQGAHCPRCKQSLEPGERAVACPRCGAWHHQSEKFPCWTYDATCALCQAQSTALDAGYSWTPELL